MSDDGFGVEPQKPITVERWLKRMWLDPEPLARTGMNVRGSMRKTKARKALTIVRKGQGVPVMIVDEDDQWDTCTKIAENPDTNEAVMAYYRKITDLQMKVTPGVDRVAVVPTFLWKKMIGTNLFISQMKKDKDELVNGIQGGAEESS
jgi:hypothetical protein